MSERTIRGKVTVDIVGQGRRSAWMDLVVIDGSLSLAKCPNVLDAIERVLVAVANGPGPVTLTLTFLEVPEKEV